MFSTNQIIRAKRNHLLAKVKYVDLSKDLIQIEYIRPTLSNYFGIFSYKISELQDHWEIIDNPDNQNSKVISLISNHNKDNYSECSHKWVSYSGLFDKFEFCSKCDKKKV